MQKDLFHTAYSSQTADIVRDLLALGVSKCSYQMSEGRSDGYRGFPVNKVEQFQTKGNKKTASVWFL